MLKIADLLRFITLYFLYQSNGLPNKQIQLDRRSLVLHQRMLFISIGVAIAIGACQTQATPEPLETSIPSVTHSPITSTPTQIQETVSGAEFPSTPITLNVNQGLTWLECAVPDRNYYYGTSDNEDLTRCFEIPEWADPGQLRRGTRIQGENGSDLVLKIGDDRYLALHDSSQGCCEYQLLKNDRVIFEASAPLITFDPNRNLYDFDGNLAWELIADPPLIFYNGNDLNRELGLQGSYYPYFIQGKLIFIAKQGDSFQVFYDHQAVGPAFEEISLAYCCGNRSVVFGSGQYWFIGKRAGVKYVVLIE